MRKILLHAHARTFAHSFFNKHGRDRLVVSPGAQRHDDLLAQPLTWTQWASNPSSWLLLLFLLLEPDRKTSQNTGTTVEGWGGSLLSLHVAMPTQYHHAPPAPLPRQHSHAHAHMALGELVRTTLTSLGSPDHLHPEDCGKLRVMWVWL